MNQKIWFALVKELLELYIGQTLVVWTDLRRANSEADTEFFTGIDRMLAESSSTIEQSQVSHDLIDFSVINSKFDTIGETPFTAFKIESKILCIIMY